VVILVALLGKSPQPDAQALADAQLAEGSLRAAVEKIRAIAAASADKARLPRPTMVAATG
jgi:hypothetical protein